MGPKAGLDNFEKNMSLASTGIRAPDREFRSLVSTQTTLLFVGAKNVPIGIVLCLISCVRRCEVSAEYRWKSSCMLSRYCSIPVACFEQMMRTELEPYYARHAITY